MTQKSEYSNQTGEFKLPGREPGKMDTYTITLLNVQATFKLQFLLGNQIKFAMGDKGIDPDLMWSLAVKLLKYADVNGFELSEADFEEHFQGRVEILDRVVVEALKLNLPGFTKQLSGMFAQWIRKASELVNSELPSETSNQATAETDNQSSQ